MKIFVNNEKNKYPFLRPNSLYFDIETTGFIKQANSNLYMIGMFYLENEILNYIFLFANEDNEEALLLHKFNEILKDFNTIVTFNGNTFDIPYIKWKYDKYNMPNYLADKENIDILKDIRRYGKHLPLPNCRQKSIEEFLGLKRQDPFNGGQLIDKYKLFLLTKNSKLESQITTHNFEDLSGMAYISNIYNYLLPENWTFNKIINTSQSIDIMYKSSNSFITPYENYIEDFCISFYDDNIIISLPVEISEKKMYFNDYENYIYLISEDIAIHKSIGNFVDSKNKINANKNNAYTRKIDRYIKLPCNYDGLFCDNISSQFGYLRIDDINKHQIHIHAKKVFDIFKYKK